MDHCVRHSHDLLRRCYLEGVASLGGIVLIDFLWRQVLRKNFSSLFCRKETKQASKGSSCGSVSQFFCTEHCCIPYRHSNLFSVFCLEILAADLIGYCIESLAEIQGRRYHLSEHVFCPCSSGGLSEEDNR
ncbi:unnamed protein product [Sphagnum troendelagicum]